MTGKLSLKELELERRHWAGTDWAWMVTEQRRRFVVWMPLTGALTQGLKGLTLRWKEAFTQEQRMGAGRLLESLSEVGSQVTSEILHEGRAARERLGGVCCPRSARQHSKVAHGNDANARLKLMSRSILKAPPGGEHLASLEEIVEFRCHHLHTATSWIAGTNWKAEASESDCVAEDRTNQKSGAAARRHLAASGRREGPSPSQVRLLAHALVPGRRGRVCLPRGQQPSLDELEFKLWDLAWLGRALVELGRRGASQY